MQNKGIWVGVGVAIAVLLIALFFLGKGKGRSPAPNTANEVTPIITPTPAVEGEGQKVAREITIEAKEFSYSLDKITVKKGEKIKLTLVNTGRMSHDFVIEKMNVTTELAGPGKSVSIEFTMFDAGSYTFYCSVGNHRAMGMEGTLIVTE